MICNDDCVSDIKQMPNAGCEIVTRSSGIKRVIFAKCNVAFVDIQDLTEWETLLLANSIHATGDIKGAKPKGTINKVKLASCLPEKPVSGDKSITFSDYASDNTNFADYDFYNDLQLNAGNMVFGYTTCDELFYGWFDSFAAEVDDVRTDDSDDAMAFDVVLTYKQLAMKKPVLIAGLNAVLN